MSTANPEKPLTNVALALQFMKEKKDASSKELQDYMLTQGKKISTSYASLLRRQCLDSKKSPRYKPSITRSKIALNESDSPENKILKLKKIIKSLLDQQVKMILESMED